MQQYTSLGIARGGGLMHQYTSLGIARGGGGGGG